MKLLLDQNLSPRLVAALADAYPESLHVREVGFGSATDTVLWTYAGQHGFAIVSKDSDFHQRSLVLGPPPKVIWLRVGNCTTRDVEAVLRDRYIVVRRFLEHPREALLVLTRRPGSWL